MTNPIKDLLKRIKDEDIQYVDVRFTDPRGTLQHVTMINDEVDEDFFENGLMFDGSSIDGWASIEKSDMKLLLDATSAYVDPFYAEKTMAVHCHVVEPDTGQTYERCPPRHGYAGRGVSESLWHWRCLLLGTRGGILFV